MVFACIIAIVVGAINSKNTNIEIASTEQAETMKEQEEKSTQKALTIQAGTPNTDNFTYVTSQDGYQIPVPKGYVASPDESERGRDGIVDYSWKKQEELTFKSAIKYYLDQELTFKPTTTYYLEKELTYKSTTTYHLEEELTLSSEETETYPWTKDETTGVWSSGNYQKANSTSTIGTNTFTVVNNGDVVRIIWSVCSQAAANTDYAYYTITNTATEATIGGTATAIYGTGYGTAVASLKYLSTDVALDAGTYKVEVKYTKNASTNTNLDRAYLKSINVYSKIGSSGNTIEVANTLDYAWTKDDSTGIWSSGNLNLGNTTSTIETNTFAVANNGDVVRIVWSVCSTATANTDYAYYTITNTETGATIGGTDTSIYGTGYGTAVASLTYTNTDANLSVGTYKVELKYAKDETTNTNLDRAYLKSVKVYTQSATSEDNFNQRVGSGGFVIYEKNAGETDEEAIEEIEDNLTTAQRTRNQWVWVPISREEVSNMYNVKNGVVYSNRYDYGTGGKTLVEANSGPVVQTYDSQQYDYDHSYLKRDMEGVSRNELLQKRREEFYEMLKSVKTYGGFYIGRYETGNLNKNNVKIIKGDSNISNGGSTYKLYLKCRSLRGKNPVYTGLIWDILFDETLEWLLSSGEKTYNEIASDSTSWGNYYSVTFTYITANGSPTTKPRNAGVAVPTGCTERNKANNIYDLAGNIREAVADANSAPGSYYRGGFGNYREVLPVCYRGAYYPFAEGCAARAYLLIS